jgi:Holliday junction resolvase RusA-like endonuclease|tara:strand:- start:2023 stop:2346 length:324 start_codon:yes stop_codon:yes gene_type:complete
MHKVKIKPLTVNKAWRGRRFKTNEYKVYEGELLYMLPKMKIPAGKLRIKLVVGYSNKLSDIDNCLKPFIDVLQKKYDFNDKEIYKLEIEKEIVKKGEEFIEFELKPL